MSHVATSFISLVTTKVPFITLQEPNEALELVPSSLARPRTLSPGEESFNSYCSAQSFKWGIFHPKSRYAMQNTPRYDGEILPLRYKANLAHPSPNRKLAQSHPHSKLNGILDARSGLLHHSYLLGMILYFYLPFI